MDNRYFTVAKKVDKIIIFLALVFLSILITNENIFAENVEISGNVRSNDGKGLNDVVITAFRKKDEIGKTKSVGSDGSYKLSFASGDPLTEIEYCKGGFDPGYINYVSGDTPQKIIKVMYKHGESRSAIAAIDTIDDYERLAFIMLEIDPKQQDERFKMYLNSNTMGNLKMLNIPENLQTITKERLVERKNDTIEFLSNTIKFLHSKGIK